MEAITHLLPQSEIAAESFAQHQLGDSGNLCGFEDRLWQGVDHMLPPNKRAKSGHRSSLHMAISRPTAYPRPSAMKESGPIINRRYQTPGTSRYPTALVGECDPA